MNVDAAVIFGGLVNGSIYGLVALGISIVYAATRILNFAQGEFLAVGALIAFVLQVNLGLPPLAAYVGVAAAMLVMGLLMNALVLLPTRIRGASSEAWILSTIATSIMISEGLALVFGRNTYRLPPVVNGSAFSLSGVAIPIQDVLVVVLALVVTAAYATFLRSTTFGRAIRATAHDPETTQLMGIDSRRVVLLSFVISALVTGLAGVAMAPITLVQANMGIGLMIKGFIAVLIGGLGSVAGALLGGLTLGVFDAIVSNTIPAGWSDAVVYSLLAVILLVRPTGLLAGRTAH